MIQHSSILFTDHMLENDHITYKDTSILFILHKSPQKGINHDTTF